MCDCCSQGRNIQIIAPIVKKGKEEREEKPATEEPEAR